MAFRVRFHEHQDAPTEYDSNDAFDFLEGGVLSIAYAANKAKWTEYYPPGRWVQVYAEPNHKPGQSGH